MPSQSERESAPGTGVQRVTPTQSVSLFACMACRSRWWRNVDDEWEEHNCAVEEHPLLARLDLDLPVGFEWEDARA